MAGSPDVIPPGTPLAGAYVVQQQLGDGGMAQIYRAEHVPDGRPVAIKVLDLERAERPSVVERFLREVRTSSKIHHPNVVEIIGFGETDDGRPFMAMELLEGEDLGATLRRDGPLPWERTRPILLQVLAALAAAHALSVIHRDIKPENIFCVARPGPDDFIKVFDFGIAKVLLGDDGAPIKPLTVDGMVLGTPEYMSPEQCLCQPLDPRSDLYAVGVLAYEMLTGRPPFEHPDTSTLMFQHIYEPVPPMARTAPGLGLDRGVEAVVARALAKRPDERFESAEQMAQALLHERGRDSGRWWDGLRHLFRRRR